MNRKFIKRIDLIIVGVLLISALLLMVLQNSGKSAAKAEIYIDSQLTEVVFLDFDRTITFDSAKGFLFEIKNGAIRISESPCKNKICVNTGFLSKGGQTAVCLPYKLVIKTVSDNGYDVIIG